MATFPPLGLPRLRFRSTTPLAVALCLPAAMWSRLLADALRQIADFQVSVQPDLAAAVSSEPCVWIAAAPTRRAEWDLLARVCRSNERVRVLVLGEGRPALAARALRLGASGYLDWESPLAVLVKAIRGIAAGELWAERKIALALLRAGRSQPSSPSLTRREQNVLEALGEGLRNKEIADKLAISEATVKSHLNRIYHKLHLNDRLQAALYVERHGMEG